tara:strand:+ start:19651 stop:21168 length:1518 start_codon:yes stop_codon:yes gene_type:complete
MQNDEVLQATLLLSCFFNKSEVRSVKPLTPTEYARFATWLHQSGYTPASLLHDQSAVVSGWQDPKGKITAERINTLLARGTSMGFALEHWAKHGLWVVSRAQEHYPKMVREKIGEARPPIFFGVGNKSLLNKPGIGFVGSRSIDRADEEFTKLKAQRAVEQGYVVVSGGAKGIDQTSMLSALACGGESVGILADSLLRASASKAYREGLKENRLALISPFYPEASFNTGNAMARNKYIYAMSKSVVVVKSDYNKGGTWTGAKENLKKQWVPLLVRDTDHEGNRELIKLGGMAISDAFDDFSQTSIISSPAQQAETAPIQQPDVTADLFASLTSEPEQPSPISSAQNDATNQKVASVGVEHESILSEPANAFSANADAVSVTEESAVVESERAPILDPINVELSPLAEANSNIAELTTGQPTTEPAVQEESSKGLFDDYGAILSLFYKGLLDDYSNQQDIEPKKLLEQYPELSKTQLNAWLKLLVDEGYLARPNRKLIYKLTDKAS